MGVVRSATSVTLPSHEASNYSANISSPDVWSGTFSYRLFGVLFFAVMALVILAAVSYQCAATWRWLRTTLIGSDSQTSMSSAHTSNQTSVVISHSLPDLQPEPTKEEYVQEKECKKVLRQTTLPVVPARHQSFQRQLSHHLDIPSVQFSICRLEDKSESSLGLIKPELYLPERERAGSSDSTATVELEYAGKLHFALKYDPEIEGLVVKIFEARDLPVKDITGSSDPYIKVYLLPDRKKKFQTKVHRKNLNPIFNETFIFSVNYEDLQHHYLQFSVYDFDRFSRHDLIGQIVLKGLLDTTDLHKEVEYTMNILCPPQEKKHLGELMLSLCYLPTAGRLTLKVIKARNLKVMDITGKSDPYVKVYLLCEGKRIKKKKTSVKKSTLSPVYNEALVFDVPSENVEDVCLMVKVLDHDRIGSNELLGCAAIGNSFIGIGRDHWLEMLDNPRKPVAQWYPLLDSVPGNINFNSESFTVSLSCLNSRKRAELMEIIKTAMETSLKTSGIPMESSCRKVVAAIVSHHRRDRAERRQHCNLAPNHAILHVALKLSFDCRLRDSQTISDLLIEVYSCEKSFERLFAGALFGIRASHFTSNWKSDFPNQEQNIQAVAYFLEHSTRSKLIFEPSKVRLGEVMMTNADLPPLKAALQLSNHSMESLLLKFGANFSESCRAFGCHPKSLLFLCKKRIWFLLRANWELPYGIEKLPLPKSLIQYLNEWRLE